MRQRRNYRMIHWDDGREMGLQGMIDDLFQKSDFATGENISVTDTATPRKMLNHCSVTRKVENFSDEKPELVEALKKKTNIPIRIGNRRLVNLHRMDELKV